MHQAPPALKAQRIEAPVSMRRIGVASMIGTTIEWYDFFIFGTAAALIFNQLFFPELGGAAGVMASLATFGVAFLARPLGTILFGHLGDRIGRKKTLVSTLLLMGVATFLIGALPTAVSVGAWAAVLLVILRLAQGLALGGEWAGAVLLINEYAPEEKRGRYALFPQLGIALGMILASGTFLLTDLLLSDEEFRSFGWRVPFLASAVLVLIGLYVRFKINETPAFERMKASEESVARIPVVEVFRHQTKEIILGSLAITSGFTSFWIGYTYMTSYAPTHLGHSSSSVLLAGIPGGVILAVMIVVSAFFADKIGRKGIMIVSVALTIPWCFMLFPIVDTGSYGAFLFGSMLTLALYGLAYGAIGSLLPELFRARYRYTGAGMVQSLGAIVGGALPPILATWLVEQSGSFAVGIYMAVVAVISLCALIALKDTREVDVINR